MSGDGIDGSQSWAEVGDPKLELRLAAADATGATLALRNNPLRTLGAYLSTTRGGIV